MCSENEEQKHLLGIGDTVLREQIFQVTVRIASVIASPLRS